MITDSRIQMLSKATRALGIQELKREVAAFRHAGKNFEAICSNLDLVIKTRIALHKPYYSLTEYDLTCLRLMYINLNY